MPNQLGIDFFDLADAEGAQVEHMASADLRSWMEENHLNLTLSRGFSAEDMFDAEYFADDEPDGEDGDGSCSRSAWTS